MVSQAVLCGRGVSEVSNFVILKVNKVTKFDQVYILLCVVIHKVNKDS